MSNTPLEKYAVAGETIPGADWTFVKLLDDVLMCEFADANETGEVVRNGLYIPVETSRALWRVAKVRMKGPKVPDYINVGDYVMFGNDRGLQTTLADGVRAIFLNVDRIFGVVTPNHKPVI